MSKRDDGVGESAGWCCADCGSKHSTAKDLRVHVNGTNTRQAARGTSFRTHPKRITYQFELQRHWTGSSEEFLEQCILERVKFKVPTPPEKRRRRRKATVNPYREARDLTLAEAIASSHMQHAQHEYAHDIPSYCTWCGHNIALSAATQVRLYDDAAPEDGNDNKLPPYCSRCGGNIPEGARIQVGLFADAQQREFLVSVE